MDKAMLLMLLAQQAPKLLKGLTSTMSSPGEWSDGVSPMDNGGYSVLSELIGNRGYDPALIEQGMNPMLPDREAASKVINGFIPMLNNGSNNYPTGIEAENADVTFRNAPQDLIQLWKDTQQAIDESAFIDHDDYPPRPVSPFKATWFPKRK